MRSLKVLISAYACSPYKGSEPGMGWNFVKAISEHHNLHVITEEYEFKDDIEKFIKENPYFQNVTFHFIPRHLETYSKIWSPSFYLFYKKWQKKAYKLALTLDQEENFDITHQLNMVGYREPGYLWKINKPFVWGPIGGMDNTSLKLLFNFNLINFLFYLSRNITNRLQVLFLLRPQKAAQRQNNFLISATKKNQAYIAKYWGRESKIIPEVGQEERVNIYPPERSLDEPIKIIWSGQHSGGKALNILLKSLSKLPENVKWKLSVLGDGKMTSRWKLLARKLKLEEKITWTGWLTKEEAHANMMKSHLMCITSLKDLTSSVILEALSFGLPVICIDHCGFSYVVNENCGVKIPITMPGKLTSNFAQAISMLYYDEPLRLKLAEGAIKRATDFSWESKMEKINQIYYALVNKKKNSCEGNNI